MSFICDVKRLKPSLVVVHAKGVLDAGTAIELEIALADSLKDPQVKKIVLEIPELSFISSSGLRIIMVVIKSLVPRNGTLYMVGAAPQIIGLIKMSGMTKWVRMKNNLADCENDA